MKQNLFFILLLISISANAQVININPDKSGEPWIVGGWKSPSKEELAKIPMLKIDNKYKTKSLPSSLDNSTLPYFRPIFNQTDGCCAQASGIAYNFTYEINLARGTNATDTANQFPTHFTYNFLNGGDGNNGSWYGDGWNIIAANGCPTVATYGGIAQDARYWMSGYSNYESAINNRVLDMFDIDASTPEGLKTMKWWMYNHGDGSNFGGIVNFAAGVSDVFTITNNYIITKWGSSVNHAMTFVGWDDNIGYDVNNDGQITNNIDITGDGNVDMRDWEKGALIMVNSWGNSFGNNGKAYVLYRLLALPSSQGGIGNGNIVSSIHVRQTYKPQTIMRVTMQHSNRSIIKVIAGISDDTNSTEPKQTMTFPVFNNQGGSYPMRGTSSDSISFSLDITPLLSFANNGQKSKFFLQIYETDLLGLYYGKVQKLSIIDTAGIETVSNQKNVSITNNNYTTLSTNAMLKFDSPQILTQSIDSGEQYKNYNAQFNAVATNMPLEWGIISDFSENTISEYYPAITSNKITVSDNDDGYGMKVIGFKFPFAGKLYDTIYVRTDGSISFEPGFSYIRDANAIENSKIISVFASDLMLYPADGDGIYYYGNQYSALFRWKTSLYNQQSANIDVAIRIFFDGRINFYYGSNITSGLDWAAGVSNDDEINKLITSFSGSNNPSNKQIQLASNPFPVGMAFSNDGILSGTPIDSGSWNIKFYVRDFNKIFTTKYLKFNVKASTSSLNANSDNFVVYPNPTTGAISIQSNDELKSVKVFDITGKFIHEFKEKTFDLSNQNSGIYFLQIQTNKNIYNKKVILEK